MKFKGCFCDPFNTTSPKRCQTEVPLILQGREVSISYQVHQI